MERWKISSEIDSTMSGMDMSQIAELASAIMETWGPASSATELMPNSQGLGLQPTEQQQVNKVFGTTIKQEKEIPALPNEFEFSGTIPFPGYLQGHVNQVSSEQVPMDDFDPLESFSFWDGENFYSHQEFDACGPSGSTDMQMDSSMPPLPEYMGEDEMTRDDVFSVKVDPTLAELNSCGDTGFEYSVTSNFLSEDSSFPLISDNLSKSFPAAESHFVASPVSSSLANSSFSSGFNYAPTGFIDIKQNIQPSLSSSCPVSSRLLNPNSQLLNPYNEKFLVCPQNSPAADTFFPSRAQPVDPKHQLTNKPRGITSPLIVAQSNRLQENNLLSSSAPPDVTMATYFSKIKSEPPSNSPGRRSVTERSLSGFSSLSLSNDDESGSYFDDEDDDHDHDDDFSSDEDVYQYESDDLSASWTSNKEEKSCQPRKHRYFWQYNLQSRGAKTQNILPRRESSDPHVLNDAFDPVFSEECALPVKHSGKARRGDGNDLTPDPRKLYNIGLELKKLNKLIYNINPEGTSHGKPLSRKEKNKLASRVCRLKKKAQHEANKIKLYGLQQEHKKLLFILVDTKELLRYKIENLHERKLSNCSKKLESFLADNEPHRVAGYTASFVNEVLDKVAKGEADGGLSRL